MSNAIIADGLNGPVPVDYTRLPLPTLVAAADLGDEDAIAEIKRRVADLR